MEKFENNTPAYTPTLEDLDAAKGLIEENEILKNHPRVQMLLENNFITEEGRQLDPGNFLASMLEYLSKNNDPSETEFNAVVAEQMVVHSKGTR